MPSGAPTSMTELRAGSEVRLYVAGEQTLAEGGIAIIPRGIPRAFMVTTRTVSALTVPTGTARPRLLAAGRWRG